MIFSTNKNAINTLYCDFSSAWHPHSTFFEDHGYKWPDDFDNAESVGQARFQVIEDLKSGLCLYNYEGNLYPYTEKKIIERQFKIKESVISKRFGNLTPFRENNVYLCDTGFNLGDIQYMIFSWEDYASPFSSSRKLLYSFPLPAVIQIVLALRGQKNKKFDSLDALKQLEDEKISGCQELREWRLMERDTSPSQDEYREICELPLHHYYFQQGKELHVWLKFEFFPG